MKFLELFICLAAVALAGEYAVLANGSKIPADRHETENGKVRLYKGNGFIELDTASVKGFEVDEQGPASPAPVGDVPKPAEVTKPQAARSSEPSLEELADAAADKYGLPRKLVRSVIETESGFQPGAVSNKGAIGPMQLMPATAKELGINPHDVAQNVDGGTRYLRDLLERYNYGLWHALAAYNAGPGAVAKHRGVPPYRETVNYVKKIARSLGKSDHRALVAQASKR